MHGRYMKHADILLDYKKEDTVLAIRGLAGTTLEVRQINRSLCPSLSTALVFHHHSCGIRCRSRIRMKA